MLRLKFDPKLDFQVNAINSVVDIFKGQVKKPFDYAFQIIPNSLDLPKERFLKIYERFKREMGFLYLMKMT